MRLHELRLTNLRNIESVQIELGAGLNVFTGSNGAGKTSVLEGVYLLSHARSFRTSQSDFLLRRESRELAVYGVLERANALKRIGLLRIPGRWSARIDAGAPSNLVALLHTCAVVCFEPGSHALISGASGERRSFLDWGVFHVEPSYSESMRRYRRALQQRNALLKSENPDRSVLAGWDKELIATAQPIADARQAYFRQLQPHLVRVCSELISELGDAIIEYRQGWNHDQTFAEALERTTALDIARRYTARGPHRADWALNFTLAPTREQLSRGQEKLCAIACMLAQSAAFHEALHEWPIVVLDDLASELDASHQRLVIQSLLSNGAQVLLTGTEVPTALEQLGLDMRRFHVEQGKIQALL